VYFDSLVRVLTLSRIPLAGGSVEMIADDRLAEPGMLVAGGADLYWSSILDSSAVAMAKSGGMIRELIPGIGISSGGPIAVDDRNLYFGSIRLSDNNLARNDLLKRPLAAGPAVPLLQDGTFLMAFAVDAENVYVSVILNDVGGVYRVPIAGGEAVRNRNPSSRARSRATTCMSTGSIGRDVYPVQEVVGRRTPANAEPNDGSAFRRTTGRPARLAHRRL